MVQDKNDNSEFTDSEFRDFLVFREFRVIAMAQLLIISEVLSCFQGSFEYFQQNLKLCSVKFRVAIRNSDIRNNKYKK